ncbi:MAG: hypothetical protein CMJ58_06835 [Planctomycetaceae bacterium]|nr:hypothetical protein [Planctomycetaceae bacterium]
MGVAAWTPVAEEDLDDILFQIAVVDGRPETAERIYGEIRDRANEHAARNLPPVKHPLAPSEWSYFRHKRWLLFYRLHTNGIEVMRLIDGVRDLPRQLPENE